MDTPGTRTYRLVVAYNGARFKGWQRGNGRTVQSVLEETISAAIAGASGDGVEEGYRVEVRGAGRTDTGVHAEGQVASVILPAAVDPAVLLEILDRELPWDVTVRSIHPALDKFHARYRATARTYRYRILDGPVGSPFLHHLAWRVRANLDIAAMRAAAAVLTGTHDFGAFTADRGKPNKTRTVSSIVIRRGDLAGATPVEISVRGDGFLWKQVRTMVAVLAAAGRGEIDPHQVRRLLESRDRALAPAAAPARGLTLVDVEYEEREPSG